ncbi:MAG: HD domain-containing protein [Deltaproteobacteria bacterium]|nr:HD domain-containing protein [Deltaproteobacteria bacterium]
MILRDPVHGLVAFERPEEEVVVALLDTPEVQRLRRVRALGVASFAFPGAEHSRFAHAVGAAFVMGRFLARCGPLAEALGVPALTTRDREDALAAALIHDVGHGPLSHLFEEVFPAMPAHEAWTSRAVLDPSTGIHRVLAAKDPGMPGRVEGLVHGRHPVSFLARAVSGTFDVDRCDYLLRDSYMTGTRYGLYDLDWLLRSLALDPEGRLAVDGTKGLPAVEGFFLARFFMYQQVYFHKATRCGERLIRAVFARVADLVRGGSPPADTPRALRSFAREEEVSLEDYLRLDDHTLWRAVEGWSHARDSVLASLARRALTRSLFKTASLDGMDPAEDAALTLELQELVAGRGLDPRYHAFHDRAVVQAYEAPEDPTQALRVLDARHPPRPLEEASYLIGRLAGEPFVRRRLIFPAEVREGVEALLEARRPRR